MFEPHLDHQAGSSSSYHDDDKPSLLDELDKIAPIKSFDAFPKVQSTYTVRSRRGGVLTALVCSIIFLLVLNDLGEFLYGAPDYSFRVDPGIGHDLQLNVDLTVAMPCRYLSIDLRDAVGDRLHLSGDFAKEGTIFNAGKATSMKLVSATQAISASKVISDARRSTPNQKRGSLSGLKALFSSKGNAQKQHAEYRPTHNKVDDGPACRIYGSVEVKKVTGNLHITTLGHGYMSFEHTDHALMNVSHVIHEFSFGPFFPAIAQPLDLSLESTDEPFTAFQYFLRIVPTTYIDASRRKLVTSQYAGIPGIFFKYDLEPMTVTIRERTTTLYQFLIRLVGVVGGVWMVAAFGLRVANRAQRRWLRQLTWGPPLSMKRVDKDRFYKELSRKASNSHTFVAPKPLQTAYLNSSEGLWSADASPSFHLNSDDSMDNLARYRRTLDDGAYPSPLGRASYSTSSSLIPREPYPLRLSDPERFRHTREPEWVAPTVREYDLQNAAMEQQRDREYAANLERELHLSKSREQQLLEHLHSEEQQARANLPAQQHLATEVEKLEDRIKDLQSSLETEIDKRQEAEKKEQSPIKHQSTLAREKNEQEAKFTALEGRLKATADEKALLQRRLEEATDSNVKSKYEQLIREKKTLDERLLLANAEVAKLQDKINMMRFDHNALQRQVEELRLKSKVTSAARHALVQQLKADKDALIRENAILKQTNEHLRSMAISHSTKLGSSGSRRSKRDLGVDSAMSNGSNGVVSAATFNSQASSPSQRSSPDNDPY
ncbi:uncharacterized protein EHS24_005157 [Apiotrichum porosum]|uniref:Endoplasmic reticulum-Golgi intermediate compartment protein 2 n=1 Tax=Apiotrichum porosum TaxID=105984 RepID=A0A427Y713_9TREE|nr:uncharacterized protein EHS24_005157 [Apiotrichum porosum]RSH86879.1 hypothetical protein EHS24_005157 [Apiotrichum porosum]